MFIEVDQSGSVAGFESIVTEVANHEGTNGLLILACDDNGFTPDGVDGVLRAQSLPLFGGVFPQIIHDNDKLQKGSIVAGLTSGIDVHVVPRMSDPEADYDDIIDALIPKTGDAKTMFVLVDGYAGRISALIDSLFNIFGLELNYIGGGAGSIDPNKLNMDQTPCLLTNQGLIKDSAILALLDAQSGVGVAHGWDHKLKGPFKVTESEGTAVRSLDWRPAFEVYKEVVEDHCGRTIGEENFFDVCKAYPFGITKLEAERIIRDPFTVDENGSLIVASQIPKESFVDILTSDVASLVAAAAKAGRTSMDAFKGGKNNLLLLMDCISRVLFLGDEFEKEIAAVRVDDTPLIGALTLGEIANTGRDYLELYNKTCVVGILGE